MAEKQEKASEKQEKAAANPAELNKKEEQLREAKQAAAKELHKELKPEQANKPKKTSKDSQIEELTELLKRIQADFENYKKRVENEKKLFLEYAGHEFAKNLLPVLDSFEHALKSTLNKDIELLHKQIWQILSSQGLARIEAVGKKFDPFYHEVMLQEVTDKEDGFILEELQAGYKYKDVVIRPTKVRVAKNGKK